MKKLKPILTVFMIIHCLQAFAADNQILQEIVSVRRDFFNSGADWADFIADDDVPIGKTGICISVKRVVPHRLTKTQYKNIMAKLSGDAHSAQIVESYYIDKDRFYDLSALTDKKNVSELAKIFQKINPNLFHYSISFYHTGAKSKTGSYGNFNYLFDGERNFYRCTVNIQQDSRSYVLFDIANPSKCDLYLFGQLYQSDLIYHFPFDALKFCEVGTILTMLRENKIYDEVVITRDDSDVKDKFINEIVLPSLNENYTNDGARSSIGEYVFIATGDVQTAKNPGFNCSGFMKEVCDNYIRYEKPDFKWMDINDLKARRLSERKNPSYDKYETSYDPFFGLDWIRNICDQLNEVFHFGAIRCEELNYDDKAENFGDFGYFFSDLQNVIFRDQQKDNMYFYLVSFNKYRDTRPTIPMFYHVAVLVPVMRDGTFTIRLFESGFENPYDGKVRRLMPKQIHWRRFEEDIKDKVSEPAELDAIKSVYSYNAKSGYHILKDDAPTNALLKARRLLDILDFDKQKVYVCKVPIKMR